MHFFHHYILKRWGKYLDCTRKFEFWRYQHFNINLICDATLFLKKAIHQLNHLFAIRRFTFFNAMVNSADMATSDYGSFYILISASQVTDKNLFVLYHIYPFVLRRMLFSFHAYRKWIYCMVQAVQYRWPQDNTETHIRSVSTQKRVAV